MVTHLRIALDKCDECLFQVIRISHELTQGVRDVRDEQPKILPTRNFRVVIHVWWMLNPLGILEGLMRTIQRIGSRPSRHEYSTNMKTIRA